MYECIAYHRDNRLIIVYGLAKLIHVQFKDYKLKCCYSFDTKEEARSRAMAISFFNSDAPVYQYPKPVSASRDYLLIPISEALSLNKCTSAK